VFFLGAALLERAILLNPARFQVFSSAGVFILGFCFDGLAARPFTRRTNAPGAQFFVTLGPISSHMYPSR
ncbi:MAG TPA: hypothetical protein VFS68_01665, partial [Candidatus Udaeobacter sp.]|nr:hypothetical protein [Candidatus Udaeobacter sp.]